MRGINKNIYRLIADKGEGNDSELANVFGQLSHVRKDEKNMIKDHGIIGELLTLILGSGEVNKNTGLPGYDLKKEENTNITIPNWLSPHNKKHSDGTYNNARGSQHSPYTEAEWKVKDQEKATKEEGEKMYSETGSAGDINLGQESLTTEQYKDMTPREIAEDIFQKEYNGIVPPEQGSREEFLTQLAGRLGKMPQFQEVSEEEKGFAREGFQKDVYGISKDAGKAGAQMRSAYGSGMGSSMRGAYGAQKDVTQQFKQAEQGYEQDVYGLEQDVSDQWETDFSSFLDTLPSPA